MNTLKSLRNVLVWLLVLLMAVPAPLLAQDGKAAAKKFSQEELDQMLAPIALYPDPLIGQILIASTYPLEVVVADRWAKQNKALKGAELDNALNRQPWDASVKALVPFPDVLSMMSQKLDWTQKVGDAFLAQQADVMDTVQKLRKRAADSGNLKSTEQQQVIVEREVIRVEPVDPRVIYVPVYDPWWVYGPWWWPAYPPYVLYPADAGVAIATGMIWFGAGLFVGAYWGSWGYWGWHNHTCYVNAYHGGPPHGGPPPPGGPYISAVGRVAGAQPPPPGGSQISAVGAATAAATQPWRHDPAHRGGVAYRDQATRERFGQQTNRAAMESRRSYRGYEGNWIERGARTGRTDSAAAVTGRPGTVGRADTTITGRTRRPDTPGRSNTLSGRAGRSDAVTGRTGGQEAALSRSATGHPFPGRTSDRSALARSRPGTVFEGIGRGSEVRRQSSRGWESLNAARSGGVRVGEAIRGGDSGAAVRGFGGSGGARGSGGGAALPGGFGGSGGARGGFSGSGGARGFGGGPHR